MEEIEKLLSSIEVIEESDCDYCGSSAGTESLCEPCKEALKIAKDTYRWFDRLKAETSDFALFTGVGRRHATATLENYHGNTAVHDWDMRENLLIQAVKAGNGKTHLAVGALKKYALGNCGVKKVSVLFTNFTELMRDIKSTFSSEEYSEEKVIDYLCGVDLLVIDDIGAEKVTEYVQSTVYTVLNRRYEDCLPTIATSNLDAAEMSAAYGSRMVSRLASGLVVKVEGTDNRVRKDYTREVPEGRTQRRGILEKAHSREVSLFGSNLLNWGEIRKTAAEMIAANYRGVQRETV